MGTLHGPLFIPPVGTTVHIVWLDGVEITGEVDDHFEDGTGYVVADANVFPEDVDYIVTH